MRIIILAGGKGTRLAPLTDKMPKALVPVHGKPFLEYLLDYYYKDDIIMSVGHMAKHIVKYCKSRKEPIEFVYEKEPLGTAGAILAAEEFVDDVKTIAIINGDTYVEEDLKSIVQFHKKHGNDVTCVTAINMLGGARCKAGIYIINTNAIPRFEYGKSIDELLPKFKSAEFKSKKAYIDIGTHEGLRYCKTKMFGADIEENI